MPDQPLTQADPDDLRQALAFALAFDGRRRFRHAEEIAARITADHLVRYLEMAGYVAAQQAGGRGPRRAGGANTGDQLRELPAG